MDKPDIKYRKDNGSGNKLAFYINGKLTNNENDIYKALRQFEAAYQYEKARANALSAELEDTKDTLNLRTEQAKFYQSKWRRAVKGSHVA